MAGTSESAANLAEIRLPDFRNLGVMLRIVLLAEMVWLFAAFSETGFDIAALLDWIVQRGAVFEPALLSVVVALILLEPWLRRQPYHTGCGYVAAVAALIAGGWRCLYAFGSGTEVMVDLPRDMIVAAALSAVVLAYFNWRHRVLSPALSEARLMALQARIRPHFLFNSLNTALGLIREEPGRAEAVLENLAELYRSLLAEPATLVPLGQELELAKAYAEIESMRLGDRLTLNWQDGSAPMDALVPPLILQPLVENAVYHGIEPATEGGTVSVIVFVKGDRLNLVVRNPCQAGREKHVGNRMALDNIRERLDLHFDAEAAMRAYEAGGEYVVQIRMPYRNG